MSNLSLDLSYNEHNAVTGLIYALIAGNKDSIFLPVKLAISISLKTYQKFQRRETIYFRRKRISLAVEEIQAIILLLRHNWHDPDPLELAMAETLKLAAGRNGLI